MKQYRIKVNGKDYDVAIDKVEGKRAEVCVNGTPYEVEIEEKSGAAEAAVQGAGASRQDGGAASQGASQPVGGATSRQLDEASAPGQHVGMRHALHPGATNPNARDIVSPLPGVILGIYVGIGEKVSKGQKVAVLEAMKMENEIEADTDGTVSAIHVKKNDSVLEGARIVTIER